MMMYVVAVFATVGLSGVSIAAVWSLCEKGMHRTDILDRRPLASFLYHNGMILVAISLVLYAFSK